MELFNPNTPLSNFIYTIINEKNKQIKENILLGNIIFPKILFYSKTRGENIFKTDSHINFLNNLNTKKHLIDVQEEKSNLEKKVNLADNQLLSIKKYNISQKRLNINNDKYVNTILNNNNSYTRIHNNNRYKSETSSKSKNKNKNKKSSSLENKNENMNSLPTLGKDRRKKKLQNIALKPFQIKSFKSNLKVHNHETEEILEKNAKAFIQKINNKKKDLLAMINKKHEKYTLKLKNEIEKIENQKKIKYDEYNKNNNIYYNYSNLDNIKRDENKYSLNNSNIRNNKSNILNKKYFHYSPYDINNPKMLKNLSKDLLNFNSELYYNNNIPDIIQYQYLISPYYNNINNTRNMLIKADSTPLINVEEDDNLRNNADIIDMTNGDTMGNNVSRLNNYSNGIEDTNIDYNMIDNSFNKKHLYYFNELKYENELTSGDNNIIEN